MTKSKNSSEGLPELRIKDSVDDGIEAGVDIAKQGGGLESKVTRWGIQGVFYTEGVKDITGEEWNPAHQECGCNQIYINQNSVTMKRTFNWIFCVNT